MNFGMEWMYENSDAIDLKEMDKLEKGLIEKGIEYDRHDLFNGQQIECNKWDAVIHFGSYGHEDGLLEIMGNIVQNEYGEVEGYLSAEDILSRL